MPIKFSSLLEVISKMQFNNSWRISLSELTHREEDRRLAKSSASAGERELISCKHFCACEAVSILLYSNGTAKTTFLDVGVWYIEPNQSLFLSVFHIDRTSLYQ